MSVSTPPIAETAAQHLVPQVPFALAEDSVGSTLSRLPSNRFDSVEAVYIVDKPGHLCGLVRLRDLLVAPRNQKLGEMMTAQPPAVYAHEDQERVAGLAIQHGLADVPVIDLAASPCWQRPSFWLRTSCYNYSGCTKSDGLLCDRSISGSI